MSQSTSTKDLASDSYYPDGPKSVEFQIHSNLTSSSRLLGALERRLPRGSYTVEMRHNIYTVRVDSARVPSEWSSSKTVQHHL
ncbi:hypothetical protein CCUS01_00554 [Colletotrichum cuscutae]|uniref:Uncharacterized protein n=1 Tax=Colletotrichum cuscutae TaxID=1209917 RepID=A0AAI9VAJ2_9PEZI|nr:hypothetical protein CCUS01_00554 [Colletotrichum cuscutae]